jgi:hypothetical protein
MSPLVIILGTVICAFYRPVHVNLQPIQLLQAARVHPRQPNVRLSSSWRKKSGLDRLRLAGAFVGTPAEYDDHPSPVAENAAQLNEAGSPYHRGKEWTRAATLHQDWWAQADRRTQALTARRSTLKASGKFVPEEQPERVLSASGQKRREAMRLYQRNEAAWNEQRQRDSANARAKREPEGKAELQRRRSEKAKQSYATRRTRAAQAAKDSNSAQVKGAFAEAPGLSGSASASADGEEEDPG